MADSKLPELLTPMEAAAVRRTTTGHLANERSRGSVPDMQTRRPRFLPEGISR
jgi:hypothetical protein